MNEKEKQIEEMALTMCEDCATYTKGCKHHPCDAILDNAATLYNAGYRKQSVGEWVTKGDIFKSYHCSVCNYSVDYHWQRSSYCPRCGAKMGCGAE